ncbi:hypothetical protein SLA2020_004260 [Shorea laevis]
MWREWLQTSDLVLIWLTSAATPRGFGDIVESESGNERVELHEKEREAGRSLWQHPRRRLSGRGRTH